MSSPEPQSLTPNAGPQTSTKAKTILVQAAVFPLPSPLPFPFTFSFVPHTQRDHCVWLQRPHWPGTSARRQPQGDGASGDSDGAEYPISPCQSSQGRPQGSMAPILYSLFPCTHPMWEETTVKPDVAVHVCDRSSWEAGIEGSLQVPV